MQLPHHLVRPGLFHVRRRRRVLLPNNSLLSRNLQLRGQPNVPPGLSKHPGILFSRVTLKDAVHLLKRGALRLRDEEPDPHDTNGKEDSKEDVSAPLPTLEHRRGEESHSKVVNPVRRRAKRGTLGTDGKRENLRHERPADGTPSKAKGEDINPDKSHGDPARVGMVRPVVRELADDDARDHHRHQHERRAEDQQRLAADPVDEQHGGDGRDHEDNARDARCEERLGGARHAQAEEDVGGVVDDGVDSAPL